MNKQNETKCAAFWNHTNVRGGDRIFPCCRFKQPVDTFTGDVGKILHLPIYEQLRNDSLRGIKITGCEKCYYEEAQGKQSLRQKFNQEYATDVVELKYLEIGFDNICNLACDGCWEEFSSTWANIKNPNNPKKINVISTKEFFNIPDTVDKVLFLGGEPLMTNKHIRFLKKIKNTENVSVIYNTNGTFLFTLEELDLLNSFKSVEIIVSVDGIGELNNKVRSGSDWNDILSFLSQLSETTFKFSLHTVLHVNNWHGIVDVANFVRNHGYDWTTNVLTYPKNLDIINLTTDEKNQFLSSIKNIDLPNKDYIEKHILNE